MSRTRLLPTVHRRSLLLFLLAWAAISSPLLAAEVSGNPVKWHPVTLSFTGPSASETDDDPNLFLDYQLTVSFVSPSGRTYVVPGFFDGNGEGYGSGSVWRVRFSPDEAGTWTYDPVFREGADVAIDLSSGAGSPSSFINGDNGSFEVAPLDTGARGFLKWGRLAYVGRHYLKFLDGPYWLKGGVDSPENFMGYAGFDETTDQSGGANTKGLVDGVHRFEPHVGDWTPTDPNFVSADTGYDARGIIGALNYLASEGVNSIYFLPMNLGGDGRETYPFVGPEATAFAKTHYDISKLHQWNTVLAHAQRRGIALQFVLAETESSNEGWFDGGSLGVERKLFYRELVARFSYLLAIKWNLSEENDFTDEALRDFADYISVLDWAGHQLTFHTYLDRISQYTPHLADTRFDSTSMQYSPHLANDLVESMRAQSVASGRPLVIDMDENAPSRTGLTDSNAVSLRKQVLYAVYLSGGNIEWFFGNHRLPLGGDLRTEDFSTRAEMYRYMRHSRSLLEANLPFWDMEPGDFLLTGEDESLGGGQVFYKAGEVYAVYLPAANPAGSLTLPAGSYEKRWFNPRTGDFAGNPTVVGGGTISLGPPPSEGDEDWVALLITQGNISPSASFISPTPGSRRDAPASLEVRVQADDFDGTVAGIDLYLNDSLVGSDMDAPYEWGSEFPSLNDLAAGVYSLEARVWDQQGGTGSSSMSVVVGQAVNIPPVVVITAPGDGETVLEGTSISFVGTADDVEDGTLSDGITWSSSIAGEIGSGSSISTILGVGSHTVTASATDSGGLTGSDAIEVTVTTEPSANTPPVAEDLQAATSKNKATELTLIASDGDGDPLTLEIITQPAHGSLSGTYPTLKYRPDRNYVGPDSFTFQVNDGLADSNVASVSIEVVNKGK